MKLYLAPRERWLRCIGEDATGAHVPPSSLPLDSHRKFKLHNVDGMYSRCTDEFGNTIYPAAWTDVEEVETVKNSTEEEHGTFE
jgi:hypothetical protein